MFSEIKSLLLSVKDYVAEDGQLLKAKIEEDIINGNKNIIKLFLANKKAKEVFFEEMEGVLIFKWKTALDCLNMSEFLPDSYTKYKNKIGLTNGREEYLHTNKDVVLSFPYKDCILQGGQVKDEEKRFEIFYNEIIAKEEIGKMLEPKVFCNVTRCVGGGGEPSSERNEYKDGDNLIIKGNNLIALYSILVRFEGKIKCIYIDPPYNTGNDSFKYNDSFNHSTWLTFMKNRLEVARRLLKDDGVIFVQCDDNEQAYLKVLMDEVMGRENFVSTLHVELSTTQGMKVAAAQKGQIVKNGEFILVYAKNSATYSMVDTLYVSKNWDEHYSIYIDPITNKRDTLLNFLKNSYPDITKEKIGILYNSNNEFREFIHKNANNIYQDAMISIDIQLTEEQKQQISKSILPYKDYLIFKTSTGVIRQLLPLSRAIGYSDDFESKFGLRKIRGDWWEEYYKDMMNINKEGNILFKNAKKCERLIKDILHISTRPGDIVLDFFMGSGTTCAVAHKMGRQYIGIEQMDYIKTISLPRLIKVLEGEIGGISKAVNWSGGGSFIYCELKEDNISLIEKVQSATEENIQEAKNIVFNDPRIIPYITKEELIKSESDFDLLSLQEKKNILLKLINKNKLYVSYSDLDDESVTLNERDREFNRSFYEVDEN